MKNSAIFLKIVFRKNRLQWAGKNQRPRRQTIPDEWMNEIRRFVHLRATIVAIRLVIKEEKENHPSTSTAFYFGCSDEEENTFTSFCNVETMELDESEFDSESRRKHHPSCTEGKLSTFVLLRICLRECSIQYDGLLCAGPYGNDYSREYTLNEWEDWTYSVVGAI